MGIPNLVSKSARPTAQHSEGGGGSVLNKPRREFSARTKRRAWERANGMCEGILPPIKICRPDGRIEEVGGTHRCNAALQDRRHYYDHIDPDWFSKDNELENCQVLCETCHATKTKTDIKNIAKSKRIIDKRIKAKKSKRPFRGWSNFRGEPVYAKR